jgi:hypothetical protein
VKADIDSAVNAARRFFVMEVEARIVAAAMTEFGMDEFDSTPQNGLSTDNWDKKEKKDTSTNYLPKLLTSTLLVMRNISKLLQLWRNLRKSNYKD